MRHLKLPAALTLFSIAALAEPPYYTISTFDVPGAKYTIPRSINSARQVSGLYGLNALGPSHAFLRDFAGSIVTFDVPGAAMTSAFGINNYGQVAGQWSPDLIGNRQHAYIRDANGIFTSFDAPDSQVTGAYGINDAGQLTVVGLSEPGPARNFLRAADGTFSLLTVSGGSAVSIAGLNNNGTAVGTLTLSFSTTAAFKAMMNGTIVTFSYPASTGSTAAYGINDADVIAGSYNTGYGYQQTTHGFVGESDGSYAKFDVPGALATVLYGINNHGDIVGQFDDAAGIHGFVATPCDHVRSPLRRRPEETALILPVGGCGGVRRPSPLRREK